MGVREIYSNFYLVFDVFIFIIIIIIIIYFFTISVLQGSRKLVKGQAGDISGKNASNGRLPDRLGQSADQPFEDKGADFSSASLISKNLFSRALRHGNSTRKNFYSATTLPSPATAPKFDRAPRLSWFRRTLQS